MRTPFETLRLLPNVAGNRFGSLNLGYDRVTMLREEHALLLTLVARLAGVEAEHLVREDVEQLQLRFRSRAGYPIVDRQRNAYQALQLLDEAILRESDQAERRELAREAALWVLAAGQP